MVTQSIPNLRNQKYCTLTSAHVSQQGKESTAGNFQDPDQCKKMPRVLCLKEHHELDKLKYSPNPFKPRSPTITNPSISPSTDSSIYT